MPLAPLICMSAYYGAPTPWPWSPTNDRIVLNDKTFMDQYTSVSSTLALSPGPAERAWGRGYLYT